MEYWALTSAASQWLCAILGVVVSVKQEWAKKNTWLIIALFAFFAGLGSVASIMQAQKSSNESAEASRTLNATRKELSDMLSLSLQKQEYQRGQLEGLAFVISADRGQGTSIKQLVDVLTKNDSRDREKVGRTVVSPNALKVTINHGFNDPQRTVAVFPVPNWNTTMSMASQDSNSITFNFNVAAPNDAVVVWRASRIPN